MLAAISSLDLAVILLYLAGVGAVGVLVARRQRSTRDYFLGGRDVPWWAAALSIVATETSAVTFIGLPAASFDGDWSVLQLVCGFVLGRVFLAFVFVRALHQSEHVTVYGYLLDRFGPWTRTTAAGLFLSGRILASGVRLFAGCLAVAVVAEGVEVAWVIVGLGLFGTLFTLIGGIRSVVWTDVILGVTLLGGGLLTVAYLLADLPEGWGSLPELASKSRVFRFDAGLNNAGSFWTGLAGGFVLTLATHGTDQDIAQRMLTCRTARSGSISLLASAVLIVPLFVLFLSIGTLLWALFETGNAGFALPVDRNDLLPRFIAQRLPNGLRGLVLAGLLAAALSSLTSALNALASTVVGDFYRPFLARRRKLPEQHWVRASRVITACWGVALIGVALAFIGSQDNIFAIALKTLNYFYGGLLGAFLLGLLTRRGSDRALVPGMLLSVPVVLSLQWIDWMNAPAKAPGPLQELARQCASQFSEGSLPSGVAWPWWISIGTLITITIGLFGKRDPAAESMPVV